jgi:small-conductance mechanosensitive channel
MRPIRPSLWPREERGRRAGVGPREFVDQFLVKHEFVKRLQARYAKEGIVIPFPIRTLDLPPYTWERLRGAVSY